MSRDNSCNREKDSSLKVATFYSFSPLKEETISSLLLEMPTIAKKENVRGTILIAFEGINGTICGPIEGVLAIQKRLESLMLENPFEIKFSFTSKQAFRRFKTRRKKEIVTMGVAGIDPLKSAGEYVEPDDWNELIDDPSTLVIDTRNKYEISVGSFKGAVNPHTETFREFPEWAKNKLPDLLNEKKIKRIAMFCTGGIRCEKASSFLAQEGFSDVYHLHGGILRYLAEVPPETSRWEGECFVFDQRVALDHCLKQGVHQLCFACGMPLSPKERENTNYVPGIQCNYCVNVFSDDDRERFKERQKHIKELEKRLPGNSIWPSS